MKISFMIHTASEDTFIEESTGWGSYFNAVTTCLKDQEFKDFEFVYIDTYYEDNKDRFAEIIEKLPYPVKHVPIHHQYWYAQGYTYISTAKNTGIYHAEGELLVTCDDAQLYNPEFLGVYWKRYQEGVFCHAHYKYLKDFKHDNGKILYPLSGTPSKNGANVGGDHRNKDGLDVLYHSYGCWLWAGSSFTLEDALTLNGFNERMDGAKGLEDGEFGFRLQLLGRKFVYDKNAAMHILDHETYTIGKKKVRENLALNAGIYYCTEKYSLMEANKHPYTQEQLDYIREGAIKFNDFDANSPELKEKYDRWMNTPAFNLRTERKKRKYST